MISFDQLKHSAGLSMNAAAAIVGCRAVLRITFCTASCGWPSCGQPGYRNLELLIVDVVGRTRARHGVRTTAVPLRPDLVVEGVAPVVVAADTSPKFARLVHFVI